MSASSNNYKKLVKKQTEERISVYTDSGTYVVT